ncbi:hypothetical protein U9M48_037588 [Paspalum notatum var. saurae]|uniref:UBC core domain-containing protein n=1 Tax=Paspalum notatum var. saurae TaxID=547442 RepID=A0AAQ3UGA1_PASNO
MDDVVTAAQWCDLVMLKGGLEAAAGEPGMVMEPIPGANEVDVVRVDGVEVSTTPDRLTVVDRSYLLPGSIVVSASDLGGQAGVITRASTAVDLVHVVLEKQQQPLTMMTTGVPAATHLELRRVTEPTLGDYVVLRGTTWLGRVLEVSLDVDVVFDDGAVCRVNQAERKLELVEKNNRLRRFRLMNRLFSPGQRVAGGDSVLKASRWIKGYWKPSRARGVVAKVEIAGVLVQWVASGELGTSMARIEASAPPAYQPPSKLALFRCTTTPSSMWLLGDPCHIKRMGVNKQRSGGGGRRRRRRLRRRLLEESTTSSSEPRPPSIMSSIVGNTRTMVDVLWQDGTRQCGVPSSMLLYFDHARNDHDFFPGQHVVLCSNSNRAPPPSTTGGAAAPRRYSGVVRSLNSRDQTACVSWLSKTPACEYETVSVYDLARDLDQDLFYGDVAIRLIKQGGGGSTDDNDDDDLSWVGDIVHLCDDGHVLVKWGDGNTSKVLPHEIAVVKNQNIVDEIGGWVYVDDTGDDHDTNNEEEENHQGTAQEPPAATNDNDEDDHEDENANKNEITAAAAVEDNNGEAAGKTTAADEPFRRFPRFEVLAQSPPDHHFLDSMAQQGTAAGRKWTKRVQKEWKSLENDLPDTIYVRAFEDRMDLLRAVMVGGSGTPYHNGLFFFDIHLPPSYPAEPPLVNYRSFGLRVNPNIYASGTVCLSLLNTFGGQGAELWSPEASSILQVVVSIQGLVLTAQPYYNEPAYGAQPGTAVGRRNELPYSENAYLLTLQSMLHLLRRPPMGFEELVKAHVRRHGQHVLRTCEAYMKGCLVGTLDGEEHPMAGSKEWSCSVGFRLALQSVLPRLDEAFTAIGATEGPTFHAGSVN